MKFVGKTSQAQIGDVLITQYEAGICATTKNRGCPVCVFNNTECDRAGLWAGCPNGIIFRHLSSVSLEELEHHRSLLALKGELL